VRSTCVQALLIELEAFELHVDGSPVETPVMPDVHASIAMEQRIVFRDTFGSSTDTDARLERLFLEASRDVTFTCEVNERGNEERISHASALTGETATFDGDLRAVAITGDFDDEGVSAAILAALRWNTAAALLGPGSGRDAQPGERWSIPPHALEQAIAPGGDLWISDELSEDPRRSDPLTALRSASIGGGEAILQGTRREAGCLLAVVGITARLEGSTSLPETEEEPAGRVDMSVELTGQLIWEVEAHRPRSLALSGPLRVQNETISHDAGVDVRNCSTFAGVFTVENTFEE
jgi:hypothetical protein